MVSQAIIKKRLMIPNDILRSDCYLCQLNFALFVLVLLVSIISFSLLKGIIENCGLEESWGYGGLDSDMHVVCSFQYSSG
jgi:hypothetical protein